MQPALIKLGYTLPIDASTPGDFETRVFNDSYEEFLLQSQAYNRDNAFTTFDQMTAGNPKANSLHYKVGFSIGLYIRELNNRVAGLHDSMHRPILFATHQFELVHSDIHNRAAHRLALHFITGTLTLVDSIGNTLLLAKADVLATMANEEVDTFLVPLRPDLSIVSYQQTSRLTVPV